jgi:DNA-binding response OmpR family regulator
MLRGLESAVPAEAVTIQGNARKMREAGADAVLLKPFGLDEFRIAVLEGLAESANGKFIER